MTAAALAEELDRLQDVVGEQFLSIDVANEKAVEATRYLFALVDRIDADIEALQALRVKVVLAATDTQEFTERVAHLLPGD